jgi:membrane-associated phospholipid phosphatase
MSARSESQSPGGLRFLSLLGSRYVREPVILAAAYVLYYLARHAVDDARPAFNNARELMHFEDSLGIFQELSLQSATISYDMAVHVFNVIYFYGHFPLIAATGLYLFIKNPRVYSITRNAFLLSGAVALILFALYPVAPPRLSTIGIVDTLAETIPISYDNSPYVNPYAALPSMHVGWELLVALGLFLAFQRGMLRWAVLILPPAMFLATIVTGNHFFVDGIAGLFLAAAAFIIAFWPHDRWPALQSRIAARLRRLRGAPAPVA